MTRQIRKIVKIPKIIVVPALKKVEETIAGIIKISKMDLKYPQLNIIKPLIELNHKLKIYSH